MKSDKVWTREMKRYRILQHELRGESVYIVEWNDKWFLGLWGRWHEKFHSRTIEEAIKKIHRLVSLKVNK
jgi:RNase P/RNase MRP subunit p29